MNKANVRVSKARVMHIKPLIKFVYTLHIQTARGDCTGQPVAYVSSHIVILTY